MREEELLKKIKESAEHVTVPESLEPEEVMKKLRKLDEKISEQPEKGDETEKKEKIVKFPRRNFYRYGATAAACLALVAVIGRGQLLNRMSRNDMIAVSETTAAVSEETAGAGSTATEAAAEVAEAAAVEASSDAETASTVVLADADGAEAYRAKDYGEIYDRLQEYRTEQEGENRKVWNRYWGVGPQMRTGAASNAMPMDRGVESAETVAAETAAAAAATEAAAAPGAMAPAMGEASDSAAASGDFSQTNIQVEGVDEGDIVKTDGTYIYAASAERGTIRIIRPEGQEIAVLGEIEDTSTVYASKPIREFYLNGEYLSVIRQAWSNREHKNITYIETYSTKDAKNPELLGTVEVDGYYHSSRRNGDYLYVFSGYEADAYVREDERDKYVPCVNGEVIPAEDIYMPEIIKGYGYTVVTAIDMRKPQEAAKTKGVMGGSEQFYVSGSNIYITASKYDYKAQQYDYTEIMKLSYQDGQIAFQCHGTVDGYLNNQFSMDEYKGNLRVVSTLSHQSGVETNSLYVLDKNLKIIGEIEDLAPDEQIYSARFMGDTAYFVTYRNMDPLFSADLSDPENPKILGELKITGFSEYLHPFGDGLLLGIGQETDAETGNFKGLKLSMFDVSDPKNVTEKDKTVEKNLENSPAWYNHKAVTISEDKNIIGFAAEGYDRRSREWVYYYVVYGYEEGKGFKQLLSYELTEDEYFQSCDDVRGLYIGDWFYVVENNQITAFTLNRFAKKNVLKYY